MTYKKSGRWKIAAEPHIILRLKNVFPRLEKGDRKEVYLKDTDEVCRDLEWFLMRYTLTIDAASKRRLTRQSRRFQETILSLERILGGKYHPRAFPLALPPRDYQRTAAELILRRRRLLLADEVGLGKTVTAFAVLSAPEALPAAVVTLTGAMPRQWEEMAAKFLPKAYVYIVKKAEPYELPKRDGRTPDIVIVNYHKLGGWGRTLGEYAKTAVFDECQELRRTESLKYVGASALTEGVTFRIGLSATPIFNYGGEIWNVMNILAPGELGEVDEFHREWCSGYRRSSVIDDPQAFGTYMREQFLMLRRTRREVGRELPPVTKVVHTIDTDREPLDQVENAAAELAEVILAEGELERGDKMRAGGELDWKLRHATGVAKAPHVADFVRLLVEGGERVIVYAWHRSVYDILALRLAQYQPARFTGEESPSQKQFARDRFEKGETPILLMSLRAGAGIDGFQHVCRTVVFAELDWSPGVHEQCAGRVFRDGQPDPVTVYYLVSEEGSDPVVAETCGVKRQQIEGIKDPDGALVEELQATSERAASLARYYLQKMKRGRRSPGKPTHLSADA